jgi:hypothetical protein
LEISTATRAVIFAAGFALSACASNPARSAVNVPLEIPEPPPRVAMDPVPAVIMETPAPPERPAAIPASKPAPTPPPSTPAAAVAPPVIQPPATPVEPPRATPPPELRPGGPAGRTPTAAQVRDSLIRTRNKLDAIDRSRLNAGKRTDYDSARRFFEQAEAAVKENNLLLAESSVEKAETLADGLK